MTRHADRPDVIARHCTCDRDADGRLLTITIADTVTGDVEKHDLYAWDCPLHGLTREEAPF